MRISDWSSDVCSSDLLSNLLGKGFILPAPILPRARFRSLALPTPMSTCQQNLPIALYAYDPEGREIGGRPLGKLPRNHATLVDLEDLLDGAGSEWGHMELVRSEERRVGKECVSTCRSRWSPYH